MFKVLLIVFLVSVLLGCAQENQQQQMDNGVADSNVAVDGAPNETVSEEDQDEVCGTVIPLEEEIQSLEQAIAVFRNKAEPVQRGQRITIQVHVFVIRSGDEGHVSVEEVDGMIALLNREVGTTRFNFQLARRTEIVDHPEWYNMTARSNAELTAKSVLRVNGNGDTLNIWTANPGKNRNGTQLTGYAVRCGAGSTRCNPIRDGVVIAPWRVTTATSVHETGHWLGLLHVFEGGCSATNDRVDDTTQQKNKGKGCHRTQDTCPDPGNDPVTNYLNYGTCRTGLTAGQHERMELLSFIGRKSTPLFNGDFLPD